MPQPKRRVGRHKSTQVIQSDLPEGSMITVKSTLALPGSCNRTQDALYRDSARVRSAGSEYRSMTTGQYTDITFKEGLPTRSTLCKDGLIVLQR